MPPKTTAERMREYRLRKKTADLKTWTENNAEKCRKYRQGLTIEQKKHANILAAIRKQRHRDRRKKSQEEEQPVCKSRPALGKAVINITHTSTGNLFQSPQKGRAVVGNIAHKVGLNLTIPAVKKPRLSTARTKKLKEAVISYYKEDHISRPLPRKNQTMSIESQESGRKEHVARRVLCYTLRELYQLFKEEPKHAGMEISLSKFAELRPPEVEFLSERMKSARWNDIKSTYDVIEHLVCCSDNTSCVGRQCERCTLAKDCFDEIEALMDDDRTDILVRQRDGVHLKTEEFSSTGTSDLSPEMKDLSDILGLLSECQEKIENIWSDTHDAAKFHLQKLIEIITEKFDEKIHARHRVLITDFVHKEIARREASKHVV